MLFNNELQNKTDSSPALITFNKRNDHNATSLRKSDDYDVTTTPASFQNCSCLNLLIASMLFKDYNFRKTRFYK